KDLKDLNKRIKNLEQSKKKADGENQLLLSFLLNEIGSKDLDNLKELLAGQKLTEILAELDNRKQEIQKVNLDLKITREELSNVSVKAQEKEVKAKQEIIIVAQFSYVVNYHSQSKVNMDTIMVRNGKVESLSNYRISEIFSQDSSTTIFEVFKRKVPNF
ncbi:10234_t:CDS:2, partial [Funneliformis mosseae]